MRFTRTFQYRCCTIQMVNEMCTVSVKYYSTYVQLTYLRSSLRRHITGNGIYNTSHPLLERLTGQLEVEAPCPYNSIPYDYRMSQMWVEGTLGIVPELAPKIMLNEEGENITLSDNKAMFTRWANSESIANVTVLVKY